MSLDVNAALEIVEEYMPWVLSEDGTTVRGGCACKTQALTLWIAKCDAHRDGKCQACGDRPATSKAEIWLCDACRDRMLRVWPFPQGA